MEILAREVELVAVAALQPHPRNPRKGSLPEITESIRTNGFYGTIVAQRSTGHILAGNHRYQAAVAEGVTEIPVMWLDVDDERALKILLADNRTSDLGTYDDEQLAALLEALLKTGDLIGTGYDEDALRSLVGQTTGLTDPDEVPSVPKKATTQPGDLWEMGAHRLLCGDSRIIHELEVLMADTRASAMWTDPPYGVSYVGKTADALTIDNDDAGNLEELLVETFEAVDHYLQDGAPFYVAAPAGRNSWTFRKALTAVDWLFHETLVWAKDTAVIGHSDYHYQHEDILYGWKRGGHRFYGGRTLTTLLEDIGPSLDDLSKSELRELVDKLLQSAPTTLVREKRPKRSADHPTSKPVALVSRTLGNSIRAGQVVLDPFLGSGSTLIAAVQLGAVCYGMEIDPRYCDVIVKRWEDFTGDKAQRVSP